MTLVNTTTGQTLGSTTVYYNVSASGNGPIQAGGSIARQASFLLPNGGAAQGQLQVTVTTDYYNQVFEYNAAGTAQSNNSASVTVTSSLAAYPDLQVTGLTATPASGLQSGQTLTVDWSDANTGNGPVDGSFYDHVVIQNTTTGANLATQDLLYDPTAFGNGDLAAGGSRSRQFVFDLPPGTPGAGQIEVTVTTNYYHQVFEYNTAGPGGSSTASKVITRQQPR